MLSIAKLSANYLRHLSSNYGVKLKSTHAHELVASLFGYKSKATMLADTLCPIDHLPQAQYLVLPSMQLIAQRCNSLKDLPLNLPDNRILGEELFVYLISKCHFSGKTFAVWKEFADVLGTDYLLKHGNSILPFNFGPNEIVHCDYYKRVYECVPVTDVTGSDVKLSTNIRYSSSKINHESIDIRVNIKLQRIAGQIGYSNPDVSVSVGDSI